jgi:hypothetical protein
MHKCKEMVLSACSDMNNVSVCVDAHTIEVALSLCYRLMLSRRHGGLIKELLLPVREGTLPSRRRMPLCYRDEFARATAACCVSIALKFCQSLEEPMQDLWNWLRSGHGESDDGCQSFSTWGGVRVSAVLPCIAHGSSIGLNFTTRVCCRLWSCAYWKRFSGG